MSRCLLFYLLPMLLCSLMGWLSFQRSRRQDLLAQQLEQSVRVLAAENHQAAKTAHNTLQQLKDAVAKNRNQPADLARQHWAEGLHARVVALSDSLRAQAALLRRRTGNAAAPILLRMPNNRPFDQAHGVATQRWLDLGQQLTTCADSLRQALPPLAATPSLTLPAPAGATTVVEALADLAQAESLLLASETRVLHHVAQALSRKTWLAVPVALATAETNVVSPDSIYRARLLVIGHFAGDLLLHMACNGRPVPVDAAGIGQVRFRAPLRLGSATWTGTVRLNSNGCDTTFQVRVAYRVARR